MELFKKLAIFSELVPEAPHHASPQTKRVLNIIGAVGERTPKIAHVQCADGEAVRDRKIHTAAYLQGKAASAGLRSCGRGKQAVGASRFAEQHLSVEGQASP